MSIGQDGYLEITRDMMQTTDRMKAGIEAIDGLKLVVQCNMTGFAFLSTDPKVNILAVADVMETRG
jgi:sphinganine-1-phosphate aldolase